MTMFSIPLASTLPIKWGDLLGQTPADLIVTGALELVNLAVAGSSLALRLAHSVRVVSVETPRHINSGGGRFAPADGIFSFGEVESLSLRCQREGAITVATRHMDDDQVK